MASSDNERERRRGSTCCDISWMEPLETVCLRVGAGADRWSLLGASSAMAGSVASEIGVGSDASIIAVARLLRLLKIMAKVPALRIILSGLTAGIHSVKSILMLLMLIIFLSSILCVVIFGDNAPFHFGNVQQSMVTLVQSLAR